ncbi:unnamed protein product [Lymnaea stagnalis]|uniref:Peroxisome assembly protein 12 n=1 Tax=Lymnaea stagnalis TaxID=6523 RepID=A0AAV2HDI3_LYMST
MAEHGAHLTSLGPGDAQRPSVFEVLAQQSLMSTIKPAFQHAVRVFAEKYPQQLGKVFQYYDEIFIVLDSLVQAHYLRKYGASFAENFYGLKRVPSVNSEVTKLSLKLKVRSLACLILIPYVHRKLELLYEDLKYRFGTEGQLAFLQKQLSLKQRLIKFYLFLYPYIHSTWECLNLGYMLSYMLKKGRWHSPGMHMSGTVLLRLDPQDVFDTTTSSLTYPQWAHLSFSGKLYTLVKLVFSTTAVCLSTSLSVGVFFLQFLDWWYASDSSAKSLTALPVPHAPQPQFLKGVNHTTCPLCMCVRTNSTALTVSGYVFCYPCIADHISKKKCCPITGYPASAENLVKIYEQEL